MRIIPVFSNLTAVQPFMAKPLSSGQALFVATKYDNAESKSPRNCWTEAKVGLNRTVEV